MLVFIVSDRKYASDIVERYCSRGLKCEVIDHVDRQEITFTKP